MTTPFLLPQPMSARQVAYGADAYCAVGIYEPSPSVFRGVMAVSAAGDSWASRTFASDPAPQLINVGWTGSRFVAMASGGTTKKAYTSANTSIWAEHVFTADEHLLAWGKLHRIGNSLVAVEGTIHISPALPSKVAVTTNGESWAFADLPLWVESGGYYETWTCPTWDGTTCRAFGSPRSMAVSTDLGSWVRATFTAPAGMDDGGQFTSAAAGNGVIVATGYYTDADQFEFIAIFDPVAAAWEVVLGSAADAYLLASPVQFDGAEFYYVSYPEYELRRSPDGRTWRTVGTAMGQEAGGIRVISSNGDSAVGLLYTGNTQYQSVGWFVQGLAPVPDTIVFEELTSPSSIAGDSALSLPALKVVASDQANFGLIDLPALMAVATGKSGLIGSCIAELPALELFASNASVGLVVTVEGHAITLLPALQSTATQGAAPLPQDGWATFNLPAFTMIGTGKEALWGEAFAELPALESYSFQASGNYSIVNLPALQAESAEEFDTRTAYMVLTPSTFLTMTADSTWTIYEDLSIGGALSVTEITALLETVVWGAVPNPSAMRHAMLAEALRLRQRLILIQDVLVDDAVTLAEVLSGTPLRIVALTESLRLAGAATNSIVALAQIVEALATRDLLASLQEAQITDTAALAETLEARMLALQTLVSNAAFSDSLNGMAVVTVTLEDGVEFDAALTPTAMFLATIREGLNFAISFVFDGTPYSGYSINAATAGVTTYTNYPFNSMAVFNGEVHGASDEGLYKLGGADDAGTPIVWKLRTGLSNYGTGRNKGLDAAYLGYTASGRIALKCIIVAPTGEKIVYWYELTPRPAGNPSPGRITMGRGLRSVYWGFELTNVDAGDIELDVLELHPVVLDGRL